MTIADFSSFIQLAATLNIAFVAVEYAKSYTDIISRSIFKFQEKVEKSIERCMSHIDDNSIKNLRQNQIDGFNTVNQVEQVKRNSTKIKGEVESLRRNLENIITERCRSKSFSFISLYLFLFSLGSLFISGIGESAYTCRAWGLFSVLSILFVIIALLVSEAGKRNLSAFTSLGYCIIEFISIGLTAFLGAIYPLQWLTDTCTGCWNAIIIATAIFPYINFVCFTLIIKRRSKQIHREIDAKVEEVEEKCVRLEEEIKELVTVNNFSVKMKNNARKENPDETDTTIQQVRSGKKPNMTWKQQPGKECRKNGNNPKSK